MIFFYFPANLVALRRAMFPNYFVKREGKGVGVVLVNRNRKCGQ